MAGTRRTLQDLIRSRQQGEFVGHQGQRIRYRENLELDADDERRRFLFNIHGNAGVGKTYLTKQLQQIARDCGGITAYLDESCADVLAAMSAIAEQFRRAGTPLASYDKRSAAYQQRRRDVEADPSAPAGVAAFVTKAAVTVGLHAVRAVPVAGSVAASIDPATAADQVHRARTYLAAKIRDHRDVRLVLSPVDELTPVFVAALNEVFANRPIALFFDTYERTSPALDGWLRALYAGRYGDLPAELVTTISGQLPVSPNLWSDYLAVIADVPLKPFSDAEARQFLASKDVADGATIEVILTLSGRLPLWLATLAEARPDDAAEIGDPAGGAVERFLKWEDDASRRQIAITAALPRTLNQDILAVLEPSGQAPDLFGWLIGMPFVSRQADCWKYHEVVRTAMLRLQRAQSPSQWRVNQTALAQAHHNWAAEAVSDTNGTWSNTDWIDHTREATYHTLCADPATNLKAALTSAVKAADNSLAHARQWAELIADAGRATDNPALRTWGQRLLSGVSESDSITYLSHLIDYPELGQETLVTALYRRGRQHDRADNYIAALTDLTRAIELNPSNARAIARRGETYRLMERYDDALTDLTRAIELNPSDAQAIAEHGIVRLLTERYDDAITDLTRAIELNPSDAWAIAVRGETYRRMERYDDAITDLTRAIELNPSDAWAIGSRGQAYKALKRYDDARTDLTRAIELNPGSAWTIADRGETYRRMERYDDAITDLTRAIELNPNSAWTIGSRGETYRLMGRYDDAITDLTRAIELNPSDAWVIARRGETYRLMGRHDDAIADFDRAIELNPSDAWAIGGRGQPYKALKRYDDARTDLTRAIELNPSYDWAIADRSETYRLMGRYDDALTDLTRAIELNPGSAWAIAHRGETYRLMGRHDDAIADFNRAIELDPRYAWAIGSRGQAYRALERYDDARTDLTRAIELNPSYDWAIAHRGETYRLMGRYDDALTDLTRAINLDETDAECWYWRGKVYLALGRNGEARSDFSQALALDPDLGEDPEFRAAQQSATA